MKTIITLLTPLILSSAIIAQTTSIPDTIFEQALINLGYDTGTPNGSIATASIDTVTFLDVSNKSITDLSGIEDFTALTVLYCYYNLLTNLNVTQNTALTILYCNGNDINSLDVSQNTALTYLGCSGNQLSSLDVTQNTALTELYCYSNQLSSLDITQNTALTELFCLNNELTSLDVSQNIALGILDCDNNQLITLDVSQNIVLGILECDNNQLNCINMKNGNNTNFTSFSASYNPNLICIQVDDDAWATTNWSGFVNATASFSTDCSNLCFVGINDMEQFSEFIFYPNPTTGTITIDLDEFKSDLTATLINNLGQEVQKIEVNSVNQFSVDIQGPIGLYYLQLESTTGESMIMKVVKN